MCRDVIADPVDKLAIRGVTRLYMKVNKSHLPQHRLLQSPVYSLFVWPSDNQTHCTYMVVTLDSSTDVRDVLRTVIRPALLGVDLYR